MVGDVLLVEDGPRPIFAGGLHDAPLHGLLSEAREGPAINVLPDFVMEVSPLSGVSAERVASSVVPSLRAGGRENPRVQLATSYGRLTRTKTSATLNSRAATHPHWGATADVAVGVAGLSKWRDRSGA